MVAAVRMGLQEGFIVAPLFALFRCALMLFQYLMRSPTLPRRHPSMLGGPDHVRSGLS